MNVERQGMSAMSNHLPNGKQMSITVQYRASKSRWVLAASNTTVDPTATTIGLIGRKLEAQYPHTGVDPYVDHIRLPCLVPKKRCMNNNAIFISTPLPRRHLHLHHHRLHPH